MNEKLYDKVYGCMLAAGIGDGFGAPAEAMCKDEISDTYGGRIEEFTYAGDYYFCLGNVTGEVTDDASQMFEMAKAIIKTDGKMTVEAAADAIVNWSRSYPKYYPRNAGPTTSQVIQGLIDGEDPIKLGLQGKAYNRGTSNGAAMRVAAAGLTAPGDLDRAVENAVAMCRPSHGTQVAFAGAAAIAAGIAEALTEDATVVSVVKACIYGARRGEEIGRATARRAEGMNVLTHITRAIPEAFLATDMVDAEDRLDATVGADGSTQQSIAMAIGMFIAAEGDVEKVIKSCTNVGGDSDTIACIAGSLAGAFSGASSIRKDWVELWTEANPLLDLPPVARELTAICEKSLAE